MSHPALANEHYYCADEFHRCDGGGEGEARRYNPNLLPEPNAYESFLARKRMLDTPSGFTVDDADLNPMLFPFQRDIVRWALERGRAAIFADCGLGKTPMQLEWAKHVYRTTGKPVLIATPLAVAEQTQREAAKFGVDAGVSRRGEIPAPITITNYERLHLFDRDKFGAMVCDESSILKSFDGVMKQAITEFMRRMEYRLLCTATAAPNDYTELGTSSEALGHLGHMDMLTRFFVSDDGTMVGSKIRRTRFGWHYTAKHRLKGHAEESFWRWVVSWARALRKPSDLGYDDNGFVLPELTHRQHVVKASAPAPGMLFELPAVGLKEEREELRRTINERCELVSDLVRESNPAVVWCHLNAEGDLLEKSTKGAVQVAGHESVEAKEEKLSAFSRGEIRVLVTKPVIGGWGLNWQHCNHMTMFPSHSYEQYYQAVRRCWRFGQERPVTVDVVTTEGGRKALENLERKSEQATAMFGQLVTHMNEALHIDRTSAYTTRVEVPAWATS